MSRADLLATRLPCEHGRYEKHSDHLSGSAAIFGELHCPGGVAVVVKCDTCNQGTVGVEDEYGEIMVTDCPDCVDGLVAVKGQLIQWCETHRCERKEGSDRCFAAWGASWPKPCVFSVKWLGG